MQNLNFHTIYCDYISFSITIQPRFILNNTHIDHDGYMSAKHMLLDLDLIFMVNYIKFTSIFQDYDNFSIATQPVFTIFCPHIDDGWYISICPYFALSYTGVPVPFNECIYQLLNEY